MLIRPARRDEDETVWTVIEPAIRAGETLALPRDMTREAALDWWHAPAHEVSVAEQDGQIVGTYFLRPNQLGGGAHVANCGFVTLPRAAGRGVARAMCLHAIERARNVAFRAIQFNFVVSTNDRAVRLWQSLGFDIVGRLPEAFDHPRLGLVEVYVMFRKL